MLGDQEDRKSASATAQKFMDGVYTDAIEEEYRESKARIDGQEGNSCDGDLSQEEIRIDEQGSGKTLEDKSSGEKSVSVMG